MAYRCVVLLTDMEGVAGITVWEQVIGGSPQFEEGRRLYTGEVNSAVRACKKIGVQRIIVVDGHGAGGSWSFRSLIPEALEPGAEYILGCRWGRYIEPFITGCDCVCLIGAHAMAGTPEGVLSHTVSTEGWHNAWINGTLVGESGFLAALCGNWDVPVAFVSGDEATCREVTHLLGEKVVTAPVKWGLHRYAIRTLSHRSACELIEAKIIEALERRDFPPPFKPSSPVEIRVEITNPDKMAPFLQRPGVVQEGRCVVARGNTFWEAWDAFWHNA